MRRRIIVIILVGTIYFNNTLSQTNSSFVPVPAAPSPNTASLGMYGEVPVSLFTGLPQVSIPIYDISAKGITLPITASYYASGTKIDQHPSWIGMGWSLMAGGSITRIQHGITDERNFGVTGDNNKGFYSTHSVIDRSDWSSINFLETSIYADASNQLRNDLEPDEFMFTYPGNSGRFFLNEKGDWCVQSERPVKLVFDPADINYPILGSAYTSYSFSFEKVFKKFTLIDGFGYKYIFGDAEEAIEYSDRYYPQNTANNYFSATSWKLTKIISPFGQDIFELGYERGPTIVQLYISAYQKRFQASGGSFMCGGFVQSWSNSLGYPERGNLISPIYLKYIKCSQKNVQINFIMEASNEMNYIDPNAGDPNYVENNPYLSAYKGTYKDENGGQDPPTLSVTPGDLLSSTFLSTAVPYFQNHAVDVWYWKNIIWLKLSRIEITDASTNLTNTAINFDHDNTSTERLRLSKISFVDKVGTVEKKYQFHYNSQPLGRYLKSIGDHWGFYNNGPYLPDIYGSGNLPNIASNRESNLQYTEAGVLTEIIYPTGGSTSFEYQLNTCSKVKTYVLNNNYATIALDDYVKTVGGLRVSKITNDDGSGSVTTKEYYYVKGYKAGDYPQLLPSSGILEAKPVYSTTYNSSGFTYQANFSMPIVPLTEFSTGNYIGYSEVVEKLGDNSYTIYKFSNYDNGYTDEPFIASFNGEFGFKLPVSSKSFERGKLLEQTEYDNTATPVFSIVNTYAPGVQDINSRYVRSISNGKDLFCKVTPETTLYTASFDYFYKSAYKMFYYPFLLTSTTTKTYSQVNSSLAVEVKKEYKYNDNADIIEEKLTNSAGDLITKSYKYPADFSSTAPYNSMVEKNMISPVVEKLTYKNEVNFLSSAKTNYNYWTGSSWDINNPAGQILPQKEQTKTLGQSSYETRFNYDSYDDNENVTTFSNPNGLHHSYIWGYNKTYPIAEVVNAIGTDVAFTSFETSFISTEGSGNWWFPSTAIVSDATVPTGKKCINIDNNNISAFPDAGNTYKLTYWYKNGSSVTVAGGSQTNIIDGPSRNGWTYTERTVSGLNNLIGLTLSGTGYIDELRLYPANAQMKTYTYDPLIGITSKCDANNRITYYKYDPFGRLNIIKDQNGKILKKICYNYAGEQGICNVYESDAIDGNYGSQNCAPGEEAPVPYHVTVPQGMFISYVDQPTANQLAEDYAQNQANEHGTCVVLPVSVYGENNHGTSITVQLQNVSSGQNYSFTIYAHDGSILGEVPPGSYNITLTPNSSSGWYNYTVGCGYFDAGPGALTFYGINISSSCNSILID